METRNLLVIAVIIIGAFMRLMPHDPNFAPIGAIALFSGFYLRSYKAYIIPFGAMLLSDIFLGFYNAMPFVYISFFIILMIGKRQSTQKQGMKGFKLVVASLFSSVFFYVITNFGVWLVTDMYSRNLNGLLQSYFMAIPFFRNTMLSDLFYSTVFFYSFYWLEKKVGSYKFQNLKTIFG